MHLSVATFMIFDERLILSGNYMIFFPRWETWLQYSWSDCSSSCGKLVKWGWSQIVEQLSRWQNVARFCQKTHLWWLYVFLPITASDDVSIILKRHSKDRFRCKRSTIIAWLKRQRLWFDRKKNIWINWELINWTISYCFLYMIFENFHKN